MALHNRNRESPFSQGPDLSSAADSQSPAVLLGLIHRVSGPGQARENQTSNGNNGRLHDDIRVDEKSQLSMAGRGEQFDSDIRQPPVTTACFDSGKPFAQRIKQEHTRYPASVNNPQVETHAGRWAWAFDVTAKHPPHGFARD